MYSYLIGKSLKEAESELKNNKVDYIVTMISGGKDEDLLTDEHVVSARVLKENHVDLIVTRFKTNL